MLSKSIGREGRAGNLGVVEGTKMKVVKILLILTVLQVVLGSGVLSAAEQDEDMAVALLEYVVSGRMVVSGKQALINDASKGFKGFTPAVYENEVRDEFLKRTDIDIKSVQPNSPFMKVLYQAHDSAKQVIAEAQDQINVPNKGFKKFNPAVFADRLARKFEEAMGIRLKLTSLRNRNPANKPDQFERSVLQRFEKEKGETGEYNEVVEDGKVFARYMVPLYLAKSCLTCHGDPAGDLDIAGYKKEGYKEGDLRGAISICFPVAQ